MYAIRSYYGTWRNSRQSCPHRSRQIDLRGNSAKRDGLLQTCDNALIKEKTEEMLTSGVTTFGAISSFGTELEVCTKIPQRVVFFNELIGSNAAYADVLYNDFLERIKASQNTQEHERITPAIAIHSPYSYNFV